RARAGDRGRDGAMARGSRAADGRGRSRGGSGNARGGWVNRHVGRCRAPVRLASTNILSSDSSIRSGGTCSSDRASRRKRGRDQVDSAPWAVLTVLLGMVLVACAGPARQRDVSTLLFASNCIVWLAASQFHFPCWIEVSLTP